MTCYIHSHSLEFWGHELAGVSEPNVSCKGMSLVYKQVYYRQNSKKEMLHSVVAGGAGLQVVDCFRCCAHKRRYDHVVCWNLC